MRKYFFKDVEDYSPALNGCSDSLKVFSFDWQKLGEHEGNIRT